MVKFSVIIPNLHSPIIDKTISALENQHFPRQHYQVIVVGMDKHRLIHESDLVQFKRSEKPLSPAQARNIGARIASGEILVFTDADCIPNQDWLQVLDQDFRDPNTCVMGGGVEFDKGNYWTVSDNVTMFYPFLINQPKGERQLLPSLNLAIRQSIFDSIGGFDERYPRPAGEDSDLSIRLREAGYALKFNPRAIITHKPPRNTFLALLRHSYYQGMYSVKMDPRYRINYGLSGLIGTRIGVLFFALFLASGVTIRIFSSPILLQYWPTIPAVFLSKLSWCIGAARHPNWDDVK